jgi:hypothetical protein
LSWNFLASSSPDRGVAGTAAADLAAVLEFLARAGGHAQDGREGVRERRAAALVLSFCEGTNVIGVDVISGDWLLTGHIQVSTGTYPMTEGRLSSRGQGSLSSRTSPEGVSPWPPSGSDNGRDPSAEA